MVLLDLSTRPENTRPPGAGVAAVALLLSGVTLATDAAWWFAGDHFSGPSRAPTDWP